MTAKIEVPTPTLKNLNEIPILKCWEGAYNGRKIEYLPLQNVLSKNRSPDFVSSMYFIKTQSIY